MRILVIGDPHARASALAEFEALAEAVLQRCDASAADSAGPFDYVVVTGDLLHDHAYVHTAPLNAVLAFLRRLSAVPRRRLVVLIGNHDLASNQVFLEPRHALNAVKEWPGVTVVDTVTSFPDDGLVFAPYVPPGRFVEALDTIGRERWLAARAIFAHQEFRGARAGAHVSGGGDAWLPEWPLVVSGHYHAHQWLKKNLCYVGAPASHDFGDEGPHGLSVFTFRDDGQVTEDRLDLGLPERVTRVVDVGEAAGFEPDPRHLTRLIVTGAAASLLAFRKSSAYRELSRRVAKIVLRAEVPGAGEGARRTASYMTLLEESVARESAAVRALFEEVRHGARGEVARGAEAREAATS